MINIYKLYSTCKNKRRVPYDNREKERENFFQIILKFNISIICKEDASNIQYFSCNNHMLYSLNYDS